MASTQSATAHILTQQIHQHLDADLLGTANFLAGRLHSFEPRNPDGAHLLALTYLRLRRYNATADTAQKLGKSGRHLGCAHVYAQACLALGLHTDGIAALEKSKTIWNTKTQRPAQRFIPDTAACWTILGKLWQAHGDLRKAGDCFVEAHKTNPFTWEAFDGLCRVGADLNVQQMFKPTVDMAPEGVSGTSNNARAGDMIWTDDEHASSQPLATQVNFNQQVVTPYADPFSISTKAAGTDLAKSRPVIRAAISDWDTPVANSGEMLDDTEDIAMSEVLDDREGIAMQPPPAPARRTRPGPQHLDAAERPRQPTLRGLPTSTSEGDSESLQGASQPQRKASSTTVGAHKRTVSGHPATAADSTSATHPPIRRSNRLFGQGGTTSTRSTATGSRPTTADPTAQVTGTGTRPAKPATGTRGRIGSTVGRVVSGNRKILPQDRYGPKDGEKVKRVPSRASEREKTGAIVPSTTVQSKASTLQPKASTVASARPPLDFASLTAILDDLRSLACASYALSRHDNRSVLQIINTISTRDSNPFVITLFAKACYELGSYKKSAEAFAGLLKLQPSRTESMEIYSTVLWHLKQDATLAFLCHNLRDVDSNAPETWIAVGNAFSLAREHEQAIQAFKRAVQVDPKFTYAWTLMGHEYMANEDFDSALSSFRQAISVDRRGYGGWYGLGKVSERMGRLEDAERHYRIASSLSPTNATLHVCIGVILERLRNRQAALALYTKALQIAPASALARFKKARVLMHMRLYEQALQELNILREAAAEEANVWFLLGKCHRGLGDRGEGLRCFTVALNLDGKAAPLIKEAMEAEDEDEGDESEED